MSEVMWWLSLRAWLISLNVMLSRFVHVTNEWISIFQRADNAPCVCVCLSHVFFIHSSVGGHHGWLTRITAVVTPAALNTNADVSLKCSFHFCGYVPWSGIAGAYGSSTFSFLRSRTLFSHNGCANLHPIHSECTVPCSPHHTHICSSCFW
jgi:hypothetical protein